MDESGDARGLGGKQTQLEHSGAIKRSIKTKRAIDRQGGFQVRLWPRRDCVS
jgi:hypothetical protein